MRPLYNLFNLYKKNLKCMRPLYNLFNLYKKISKIHETPVKFVIVVKFSHHFVKLLQAYSKFYIAKFWLWTSVSVTIS